MNDRREFIGQLIALICAVIFGRGRELIVSEVDYEAIEELEIFPLTIEKYTSIFNENYQKILNDIYDSCGIPKGII